MDFTAGSPTNPTPESVKKAVLEVLELPSAKAHAYSTPMGIPEVREKIAAYLSNDRLLRT